MIKKKETRSKVMSLALKPSVFEKLQKIAYLNDISTNSLISKIMEKYAEANEELVKKYNKTYGQD